MMIRDALLPEFDMESARTRAALERAPEDRYGWKPHPRSWTMAELLTHIATIPYWGRVTLEQEQFDVAPEGKPVEQAAVCSTRSEVLAKFDENAGALRAALAKADNEALMKPWSLLMTGKPVFTMPRTAVLRGMVFNHLIHHRGQLTVYLRLNDAPVPALYGPSADEASMEP